MKKTKVLIVCVLMFVIALCDSCKSKCNCSTAQSNCSCDGKGCNCVQEAEQAEQAAKEAEKKAEKLRKQKLVSDFGQSNWKGVDKNGQEVTLVVNSPQMTLTYYEKVFSKRNFTLNPIVLTTNNYSFDPETYRFADIESNKFSGSLHKSETEVDVSLPTGETVILKKK